ncbi:hypothetical protein DVQ18_20815 [Yersinia enterocolitica]|uniref:hypothetical protein n=1 Tax=Yersinia enterocolitica TaxID=630 RepID=UPI0029C14DC3|nr:hypothetical protein [Yersinia enterocolitica]HDL7805371.1 hypothetical protein [Yersinia enterocolitica]HEI6950107.1 hypothetical protein [Yersinia enterocolitica]
MTTQLLSVSTDWTQVTDGTQTKSIQMLNDGWAFLFDSPIKPAANATGHMVEDFMIITPPTVAWVRAIGGTGGSSVDIAVS